MPDPYAIDINIFVGGLRVHESKYFSADGNDTLANAVQFVVAERARQMLLEDESKEEDELIESMISTITSIKCVGKPNRELLRFLQQHLQSLLRSGRRYFEVPEEEDKSGTEEERGGC